MIINTGTISSIVPDRNTGDNTTSTTITAGTCPTVITTGFATAIFVQTGVTNPGNATWPVNTTVAVFGAGDSMILDMGTGFATGTTFILRIGKDSGWGTASATVEQSTG